MGSNGWSRFSLRLVLIIVTIAAAYSGGRSSMDRRAFMAERDASNSRERAAQFEAELRLAQAELATVEVKPIPAALLVGSQSVLNDRWIIMTRAIPQDRHAVVLDQLGIKFLIPTEDGDSIQVVSELSAEARVITQEEVPAGFVLTEATQQDHILLAGVGLSPLATGIARLLPLALADTLTHAEAEFVERRGYHIGDICKTHFHVMVKPDGQPIASVIGCQLFPGKTGLPVFPAFDKQIALPPNASAPTLK